MTTPAFTRNRDNFCYRHPDRQSFVLCQRCLRTICPECQTQAAVGVICPECLAEQRKAQSPVQKRAQRRWRQSRGDVATASGQPVVTYSIIGVTAAVFLLQLLWPAVTFWLQFMPIALYPDVSGVFQPWRLLTMLVVHGGWIHVALNMLTLWMIGRILEPMLGGARFLLLYLISGLGAAVCVAFLGFDTAVVGASGAIFGLFAALLVIGRHLGANITGIAVILAINFALGFLPGFTISWQAHLGGAVAGAVIGLIFARTRLRSQRRAQTLLLVALVVVLLGLLVVPGLLYA